MTSSSTGTVVVDAGANQLEGTEGHVIEGGARKDLKFWMIFSALFVSVFLGILELYAVSTALPTILNDLKATEFIWFGSTYTLTSTALLPLSGGLAEAFGRRPVLLGSLAFFAVGGAIGGASTTMNMLIIGRAVQGAGAGGIFSITQIILSDMVTLEERGTYNGLLGLAWATSASIGPIVGGGLTHHSIWRWLFYINIPISGFVAVLVILFMSLPEYLKDIKQKFFEMDMIGNTLVIGSTTSCVYALTIGGVQYPWSSWRVLVPLCIGCVGFVAFFLYEAYVSRYPMVPVSLILNRSSISGYVQLFICTFIMTDLLCFLPVYFQACKGATPIESGVDLFGFTLVTSFMTFAAGVSVRFFKRYSPQVWAGWCMSTIGMGLLSSVHLHTPKAAVIGYEILAGLGVGTIFTAMYFPVLAPIPVTANAPALAFYAFVRSFAQAAGFTIGGSILQNELDRKLPESFSALFQHGASLAYIPNISAFPAAVREQVQVASADSLAVLWRVLTVMSGVGLLVSLGMREVSLHSQRDKKWTLQASEEEKTMASPP